MCERDQREFMENRTKSIQRRAHECNIINEVLFEAI